MVVQSPTETRVDLSNTKPQLNELVNQVARDETRVVIEEGGKPVAVIISINDYEFLKLMEANRARHFEALRQISDAYADLSEEEIEELVERTIAETRAAYRAESAGPK